MRHHTGPCTRTGAHRHSAGDRALRDVSGHGIGSALIDAVSNRDITVIQAITLLIAAFYVIVNLTGVTNAQYVTVTLSNVSSADGGAGGAGGRSSGYGRAVRRSYARCPRAWAAFALRAKQPRL